MPDQLLHHPTPPQTINSQLETQEAVAATSRGKNSEEEKQKES